MKTIVGKFTRSADGKPLANATLTLKLDRTAQTIIESSAELEWPEEYEKSVQLDENGAIPPGFTIRANDEIAPDGTTYELRVFDTEAESGPCPITHYRNWLELVGSEPIDLNTLDPDLYPEPEPEPVPARRVFPREPRVCYGGFFGGVIHCPTGKTGSTEIRSARLSSCPSFTTFAFYLPFKSVISGVSIWVDVPHLGNSVVVELQDTTGKRICGADIDVSKDGIAFGTFANTVDLKAGEYRLAWASRFGSGELRVRTAVAPNEVQLALANVPAPILAFFRGIEA